MACLPLPDDAAAVAADGSVAPATVADTALRVADHGVLVRDMGPRAYLKDQVVVGQDKDPRPDLEAVPAMRILPVQAFVLPKRVVVLLGLVVVAPVLLGHYVLAALVASPDSA